MLGEMELEAGRVLDVLTNHGYKAYFVGGCVRDAVLGRSVKDVDIATSALPEQVMACFPRTAPTGLQHGTVTVIMDEHTFEVTTFRKESAYEEFRRPKSVAYISSLTEDLRRRDFTMNAMAMDREGTLVDPFGGRKDLEAGLLRCVGAAEERFGEDALRMLRCIRFASAYGLEVEAGTWQALLRQAPLLRHIAMERVRSELQRMIEGAAPARAVRLLLASRLWRHFKRQLTLPFEMWLARDRALDAVSALPQQRPRWVLLLLLLEAPADEVRTALRELTFARADIGAVCAVLDLHAALAGQHGIAPLSAAERQWKLAVLQFGPQAAQDWLRIIEALHAVIIGPEPAGADDPACDPGPVAPAEPVRPACLPDSLLKSSLWLQHGHRWLSEMPCKELKELALTGSELMKHLKRPGGPWLGEMLSKLLELAALGKIDNKPDALISAAKTMTITNTEVDAP